MKDADVGCTELVNQSLTNNGLKAETEELIIAAQDQRLATRFYHSNIIKHGTNPLCRMCGKFDESFDHVISGCPNRRTLNTFKDMITQDHISIGRCTRIIAS